MIAFVDTSFVYALHFAQVHSERASAIYHRHLGHVAISPLACFEFRQSVRLKSFRHRADARLGLDAVQAENVLTQFEANLRDQVFAIVKSDMSRVLDIADHLSLKHTPAMGTRSMDLLLVANAVHMQADYFLTFDFVQRQLAEAAGLTVMG